MKMRNVGWVLVVIGMSGVVVDAWRGNGVNVFSAIVAMVGAGLVGPLRKPDTRDATEIHDAGCDSGSKAESVDAQDPR